MEDTMTLTMQGLMKMTGYTRKRLYDLLYKAGIKHRMSDTTPAFRVYDVPPEFVLSGDDLLKWYEARGYVTCQGLADRLNIDVSVIRGRLSALQWPYEFIKENGKRFFKDTPELMEAASHTRRELGHKRSDYKPKPPPVYEQRYGDEAASILEMEREKKKWVGRRGRIVCAGQVVAEGEIESVSSCGVFIKGSNVRGNLNELELEPNFN